MKSRIAAAIVFTLLSFSVAPGANLRSGLVTLEVDLSAQGPGKEVRLWVPYPMTDRNQSVADIRVSGDFAASAVYADRTNGTPILYAEWPTQAQTRKMTLAFSVERQEVIRRDLPKTQPAWNPADYADYLRGTRLGPVDGDVKKLADRITAGEDSNVRKAQAVYDWVVINMYRDPNTRGCGQGDVCTLLQNPGGKCTDISSVFVALCRAAGVPAREVFGIRLGRKSQEDISTYQHCWAEFFVPGYGWVPADPADARKAMLVEKLELSNPKTKKYREYFWGGIDEYRIAFAAGRDLVLSPRQAGPPLNTFGYPYAEVAGSPIDFYDAKTFSYRYLFREP